MKVCNWPSIGRTREAWAAGTGGGPVGHQVAKAKYLERLGWESVEDASGAAIFHVHGPAQGLGRRADVQTVHGLWLTATYATHPSFWDVHNAWLAEQMREARVTVALSGYMVGRCREVAPRADIRMIPQAWDAELWGPEEIASNPKLTGLRFTNLAKENDGRAVVLWGKLGVGMVNDPGPALTLARAFHESATVVMTADRADVERMCGALPANVRCIGMQSYMAMRAQVAACDVLLATTLESSGQLHLEALGQGKPVLGWRWGGVAETVVDGTHGYLADPGALDDLCTGLSFILARREVMAADCRARAAEFTWANVAPMYAALYEELVQK